MGIGSNVNKIRIEFFGRDRTLGKTFAQQWKKADTFDKKMRLVGHRLGQALKRGAMIGASALAGLAVAAAASLAYVGVKAVRMAVDFEESMDKIRGLTGASIKDMALYEEAILSMGVTYGVSAKAAADAMYFIAGVGFKGAAAVDVLNETLKASATGMGKAEDIAKALTRVISVYGQKNLTAAKTADILTAAVNVGNMEADEMAKNVGKLVPMAKQLGVSWDEVAGIMAASSLVLDVDEAAVAVNQFYMSLIKPSAAGIEALEDVGLSYAKLRDIIKDEGTVAAMRRLDDAFGGNVEQMAKVVGSVRSVKAVMVLLGMDAKQVDKILRDVKNSTGSLDKSWKKVSEGTGVKFRQMTEGLNNVLIKLGAAILPAVRLILEKITTKWLPKFSNWVSDHKKEITDLFVKIANKVAAFGDYLIKHWPEIEKALGKIARAAQTVAGWIGDAADAAATLKRWLDQVHVDKADQRSWLDPITNVFGGGKAEGGIVNAPVIAGEDGPEAIIPLTKPNRAAQVMAEAGLLGGAAAPTVVNVYLDSEPIAARVEVRQAKRARVNARTKGLALA